MKPAALFLLTAISILSLSTPVFADECVMPEQPSPPPSGAKATQEEMVSAMRASRQFDAAVKVYQTCIDAETEKMIAQLGDKASETDINRVRERQNNKVRDAGAAAVKAADAFNVELRAFKAKSK